MANKQKQKSGDNSQQIQAQSVTIINSGINEKRAREICQEVSLQLKERYTQDAIEIANARVSEFENRLLPKMCAVEGALEAFADPGFQLLLLEAQKRAASTERPADYDLLSELLIHRFQKGSNRITRSAISRAVEIVDEISDEALLGLTVLHVISRFSPGSRSVHEGLDFWNDSFGRLLYATLPIGKDWLDHLDILDTIRIDDTNVLKKIDEFYPKCLSVCIDVGIKKESENYDRAQELIRNAGLPADILIVENELNVDYMRVNVTDKSEIDSLVFLDSSGNVIGPIAPFQKEALRSIYDLYVDDDNIRQQNMTRFMEEWNKRPNLKLVRDWWDNIEVGIQITSVGRVLAHSNAQRCDKAFPPLD